MRKQTTKSLHRSSTTESGGMTRHRPEKFNRVLMIRVSPEQEKMVDKLVKDYGVSKSFVIRYGIESTYAENKVK